MRSTILSDDLIDMLKERDEKTIVVMFGDHLPTMGLTESDMKTGSLFKTQYADMEQFRAGRRQISP